MHLLITFVQAKDVITLKSGMVVEGKIVRVNSWGFNLDNNRSVQFRSLQSITTHKKNLVDQVINFLPAIEIIANNDSTYFMNFQNVKYPPIKHRTRDTFTFNENCIIISISSLKADRYKLEVNSIFSDYMLLKLGFGYSEYPTTYTSDYSPPVWGQEPRFKNGSYQIYGPFFGIGINLGNDNNKFRLSFNYSYKFISLLFDEEIGHKEKDSDDATFMEFVYHRTSIWKQLVLSVGFVHYLNVISVANNTTTTGFILGVGWIL